MEAQLKELVEARSRRDTAPALGGVQCTVAEAAAAGVPSGGNQSMPAVAPQHVEHDLNPKSNWSRGPGKPTPAKERPEAGTGGAGGLLALAAGADDGGVRAPGGTRGVPICVICLVRNESDQRSGSHECPQCLCPTHCAKLSSIANELPGAGEWKSEYEARVPVASFRYCKMISHNPGKFPLASGPDASLAPIPSPPIKTRKRGT